jgi:hypothetical protein
LPWDASCFGTCPMRSQLLLAAVSCALVSGCLGDLFNLQSSQGYGDDETVEVSESRFAQCAAELEQVDDDLYIAADFPEPLPGETRYDETPVSAKGCIRWFRRVVNGQLVSQGLIAARGDVEAFNLPDGGYEFREQSRYLAKEDFTPTSQRLEIDSDGDGYLEAVMVRRFDSMGLLQQVISFFGMSDGLVTERRTLQPVSSDSVRWIEEKLVSGTLVVLRDVTVPALMETVGDGAPITCRAAGSRSVQCTPEHLAKIEKLLKQALKKGKKCLDEGLDNNSAGGATDRKILEHLIKTRAKNITRTCFEDPKILAQIHLGQPDSDPYGPKTMDVNIGHLDCDSDARIQSTLFHEMLHISRGPHDGPADEALFKLSKEGKLPYEKFVLTDSIRACEAYCFEGFNDRCTCAACFRVKNCDAPCKDKPPCDTPDFDGGYLMTQAVGTLCLMPPGMESGTRWFNTLAACKSSCPFGKCISYGTSCNSACN